MVVPKRFELLSSGSEPDMLPLHYGTLVVLAEGVEPSYRSRRITTESKSVVCTTRLRQNILELSDRIELSTKAY
jgi:hypothetical protein